MVQWSIGRGTRKRERLDGAAAGLRRTRAVSGRAVGGRVRAWSGVWVPGGRFAVVAWPVSSVLWDTGAVRDHVGSEVPGGVRAAQLSPEPAAGSSVQADTGLSRDRLL